MWRTAFANKEEDDEDSDDGERPEDQDTVISEDVTTGEQNIIPPAATKAIPAPIILVDLCEDNSNLHKDAVFLDQLGKFLSDAKTKKKFRLHQTSFKRNYITARHTVKNRLLQCSGEGNQLKENNDNQGEAEEVEEHNQNMAKEDCPNLFENLFN